MSRSTPRRPPGINTSGASYQSVATFDDSAQVNQRPAPSRGSQHAPRQHNLSGDFGGYENPGSTIPLHPISTQSSSSSRQSYGQAPPGISSPLTPKPGAWAQTNTAYDASGRERKVSFPVAQSPSVAKLSDPFDPYSATYPSSFTVGTPATPGPAFPQATPLKKPRRHPFSKRYEAPDWGRVFRHFVLCGLRIQSCLDSSLPPTVRRSPRVVSSSVLDARSWDFSWVETCWPLHDTLSRPSVSVIYLLSQNDANLVF